MVRGLSSFLVVVALGAVLPVSAAERIAVMETAITGLDEKYAPLLTDLLSDEIASRGEYEVVGAAELKSMLSFEAQRQLMACDDTSCMTNVAGALEARYLFVSRVGKIAGSFTLSMRVIDLHEGKVPARLSRRVKGSEDDLLDVFPSAVRDLVRELAGEAPLPQVTQLSDPETGGSTSDPGGLAFAPIEEAGSTPAAGRGFRPGGAAWTGIGLGLCLLGAAGGLNYSAYSISRDAEDRVLGSQARLEQGRTFQTLAWVGYGVGAAALGTGFALSFRHPQGAVTLAPAGRGVVLAGSF